MKRSAGLFLGAALLAMMLPGGSVDAHLGGSSGIIYFGEAGLLQGESYSSVKPGCDPGTDGEHTLISPRDLPDPLGIGAARIPYSHCMIAWWDGKLSHATEFTKFRIRVDQPAGFSSTDDQTFLLRVWADDSWDNRNLVASGRAVLSPSDGYVAFPFTERTVIPVTYNYRTIKVEAVPEGTTPAGTNVWVDWIEYGGRCLNAAPLLNKVDVDGLVNGLIGWAGLDTLTNDPYSYTFRLAGVRDPDGDPFQIIVDWSDDLPDQVISSDDYLNGVTSIARSFDLSDPTAIVSEVVSFVVTIVDDPSLRCLDQTVDALYRSLPLDFVVIPDLVPQLLSPIAGISCHQGQMARTWTESGLDSIFGSCPTAMTVAYAGLPPGSILGGLRVGEETVGSAIGTDLSFDFAATRVAEGFRSLEACYSVPGDKYARDFCSEPYYFENKHCTNALPSLTGITGDGMVSGLHVWLGLPYTLTAAVSDPNGDPVQVEWLWEDQPSDFGATATRSFYAAGAHPFALRLTEDISARCPDAPTQEVLVHGNMIMAVPDWQAVLQFPREGMSCVAQRYVPTWIGLEQDVMASQCDVHGLVEIDAPGMAGIARGSFLLDGQTMWQGASSVIKTTYNSLQYPTEDKTLSACFKASGDKYTRVFCSEEFEFLNVGR